MHLKKRKREFSEDEKLRHQMSKEIHREMKKAKGFLTQKYVKCVRKNADTNTETKEMKILESLKSLDLTKCTEEALIKIGMGHVGISTTLKKQEAYSNQSVLNDEFKKNATSLLFSHKLITELLAKLDQLATTRRKQKLLETEQMAKSEQKLLKQKKNDIKNALIGGRSSAPPESVFLTSLSGEPDEDDVAANDSDAREDEAVAELLGEKKKKNRPGQRERKKKAIERENKQRQNSNQDLGKKKNNNNFKSKKNKESSLSVSHPTNEKFNQQKPPGLEISHPSWIAKQAQKEKEKLGINGFAGKKITFDD